MEPGVRIARARSKDDWRQARRLILEYAASLGVDLSFQDFDSEVAILETGYARPNGRLLLARRDCAAVGCVALRRFSDGVGELKRLYVVPEARGSGLGRRLAEAAIAEGRAMGFGRLVLDTLPSMGAARALYASLGFVDAAPYRYNPIEGTAFLELVLG